MAIDINGVIEYYKNLLIIQYNNKEKARATIGLLINTLLQNDIYGQVQNAFDLETAEGNQLDVLGKYIGADRFVTQIGDIEGSYFGFTSYATLLTDTTVGFTDYINYNIDGGGTLTYNNLNYTQELNDFDYRFILKMRIVQNNSNHSQKSVDDGIFIFFGNGVILSTLNNMSIVYFVDDVNYNRAIIAFKKGVLPRPITVNLNGLIRKSDKKYFGFIRYGSANYSSPIKTGFTRYGSLKQGQVLTYGKVVLPN